MSDESDLSTAIIETTEKYSHVGIYFDGYIYHASRKRGVAKQILEDYLTEEKCDIYIYRYPMIDTEIVMERAERYLGCEYNHSFYPDNGMFYCSQYIVEILPIFDIIPMKFGDGEKEVSDYWKKYYEYVNGEFYRYDRKYTSAFGGMLTSYFLTYERWLEIRSQLEELLCHKMRVRKDVLERYEKLKKGKGVEQHEKSTKRHD